MTYIRVGYAVCNLYILNKSDRSGPMYMSYSIRTSGDDAFGN